MGLWRWFKKIWLSDSPGRGDSDGTAATGPLPAPHRHPLSYPSPAIGEAHLTIHAAPFQEHGPTLLRLEGTLNLETADQLEAVLLQQVEQGVVNVVVDFSGVPYVSSRAWGTLISLVQTLRKRGGDIQIAGMCPNVAKLFYHTGLSAIFETFTLDPAVPFPGIGLVSEDLRPKQAPAQPAPRRKSSPARTSAIRKRRSAVR